ncbi:VOC family protein [Paenibacillus rigui]|uniref:Glutathione transferase n=1 Tax=Paenibacillus rigui TaxID=554312 RepID=A0A229UXU3_9BACL|nr:VOC family protein [Paenibacillus rigui]OXM88258.1 glutathione transferase [Paenibacillus rigui]
MKATGFNHVTLRVSLLSRSLPFYVGILGMKLVHQGRTDVYLEWGSAWICLLERPQNDQNGGNEEKGLDHLAFSIDETDFPAAVETLLASGTTVVRGPVYRGGGWSLNFLDPDENQLELFTGTLTERMKVWNAE